jgi:beta-lactamase regulating signal transducer with metallopeptidase domain
VAAISSWILTYWLHSALACALALVAARGFARDPAQRDILWKLALLLPLATASIAVAGAPAFGGTLEAPRLLRSVVPREWTAINVAADVRVINGVETKTTQVNDALARAMARSVVALAAVFAFAAALGFVRRHRALGRAIRSRRQLERRVAQVRLSQCDALQAPIALGRDEICVPPSFWALSIAQQRSVLAHEVAHLERRDPLWIGVVEGIAALSAFQPLARCVAVEFRRDAEFICDELAVRETGEPRSLVESLAALARPFDAAAPHLAASYDGSPLVQRAERVLQLDPLLRRPSSRLVWVAAGVMTIVLLALTPRISATQRVPNGAPGLRMVVDTSVVLERPTR